MSRIVEMANRRTAGKLERDLFQKFTWNDWLWVSIVLQWKVTAFAIVTFCRNRFGLRYHPDFRWCRKVQKTRISYLSGNKPSSYISLLSQR
jgi:hypothetical protein